MGPRRSVAYVLVAVLLAAAAPATAGTIAVPNASFESPTVPDALPYATPDMASWHKTPLPAWWTYGAGAWNEAAGTFLNVPAQPIDNVDGNQAAFLFGTPDMGIYQDLTATFRVGESYHLALGVEGGGYGMPVGSPVTIILYHGPYDDDDASNYVGSATYLNTNTSGVLSHLHDVQLDIPTVTAGDAWAGQTIGVQILATADFGNMGGYWVLDNVQLTAAPEPASAALLSLGAIGLLGARRRRKRA